MIIKDFLTKFENGDYLNPSPEDMINLWEQYECPIEILHIKLIPIYEILHGITNSSTLNNFDISFVNHSFKIDKDFTLIHLECPACTGLKPIKLEIYISNNKNLGRYTIIHETNTGKYEDLFSTNRVSWVHTFLNHLNITSIDDACQAVIQQADAEMEAVTKELAEINKLTKEHQQKYEKAKELYWMVTHSGKKPMSQKEPQN